VGGVGRRLAEAARLGFTAAVVPPDPGRVPPGLRVLEAPDLRTALAVLRDPDAFTRGRAGPARRSSPGRPDPPEDGGHPAAADRQEVRGRDTAGQGRRLVSVPAAGGPGPPPPS
jgi:DNA repair protein RadA/Sms